MSRNGFTEWNLPSSDPYMPSSYTSTGVSPARVTMEVNAPSSELGDGAVCTPYIPEKFAFNLVVFVISKSKFERRLNLSYEYAGTYPCLTSVVLKMSPAWL